MNDLAIPRKRKFSSISTKIQQFAYESDTDDQTLIDKLPLPLRDVAANEIVVKNTEMEININKAVTKLEDENRSFKTRYLNDILTTYNEFATVIQRLQETNSLLLEYKIRGKYHHRGKLPSLEYWKECNPGKYAAIDIIVKNLVEKGWSPKIEISSYSYDPYDYVYDDGDVLCVTCDFNDDQ